MQFIINKINGYNKRAYVHDTRVCEMYGSIKASCVI